MLCTATDTFTILAYSVLCFFRYMPVYSIILSVIEAYSRKLRHYLGIFRLIQAYSAPCVTLAYSRPSHTLNSNIFRTVDLLKTQWNFDQVYLEPCHRALYSNIQAYSEPRAMFLYAETWHTRNPGISRTLR